ncbi:hypothetical protein RUM44_006187 [Polyplax serrata]|uniref:PTPRJ transmembrane domain-containing protein n=1 Tax=Polyplax serrata TaxID=468196 RepID=A0ABR1AZ71_POLSC
MSRLNDKLKCSVTLVYIFLLCRNGFVAVSGWQCRPAEEEPQHRVNACGSGYLLEPDDTIARIARPDPYETEDPTTQALVHLRKNLFSTNQDILYYSILITEENYCEEAGHGFWNTSESWPDLPNWTNATVPYQVTPIKWNPFKGNDTYNEIKQISYVLGDGSNKDGRYWNKPLTPKTKYAFKIRAFTNCSYRKYAEDLLNNPGRLGNEFHLLGTLSSDVSTLCLHAQRVDNKQVFCVESSDLNGKFV